MAKNTIPFVRAGKRANQEESQRGLLLSAKDSRMEADLDKQLRFPPHIADIQCYGQTLFCGQIHQSSSS